MPDPTPTQNPLMNHDAIFAFVVAVIAKIGEIFGGADPHIAAVCQGISQVATVLGAIFHLDGK